MASVMTSAVTMGGTNAAYLTLQPHLPLEILDMILDLLPTNNLKACLWAGSVLRRVCLRIFRIHHNSRYLTFNKRKNLFTISLVHRNFHGTRNFWILLLLNSGHHYVSESTPVVLRINVDHIALYLPEIIYFLSTHMSTGVHFILREINSNRRLHTHHFRSACFAIIGSLRSGVCESIHFQETDPIHFQDPDAGYRMLGVPIKVIPSSEALNNTVFSVMRGAKHVSFPLKFFNTRKPFPFPASFAQFSELRTINVEVQPNDTLQDLDDFMILAHFGPELWGITITAEGHGGHQIVLSPEVCSRLGNTGNATTIFYQSRDRTFALVPEDYLPTTVLRLPPSTEAAFISTGYAGWDTTNSKNLMQLNVDTWDTSETSTTGCGTCRTIHALITDMQGSNAADLHSDFCLMLSLPRQLLLHLDSNELNCRCLSDPPIDRIIYGFRNLELDISSRIMNPPLRPELLQQFLQAWLKHFPDLAVLHIRSALTQTSCGIASQSAHVEELARLVQEACPKLRIMRLRSTVYDISKLRIVGYSNWSGIKQKALDT